MFKSIWFLTVIACAYGVSNQLSLDDSLTAQIISYIFNNDGFGNYKFGFSSTDGIERFEESTVENANTEHETRTVKGSYSYRGADGKMVKVKYTADKDGFHPEGDNIYVPARLPTTYASEPETKEHSGHNPRFNRQYVTETQNTFHPNPQNFDDYHTEVTQLLQRHQDDQHFVHEPFSPYSQNVNYNNELQDDEAPRFDYQRPVFDVLKSRVNERNSFTEPRFSRPKPIVAILGDDGKLIESTNFENLNLPESILELLSRGNVPSSNEIPILEKPKLKEPEAEERRESIPVEESLKNEDGMETNESSYVMSSTVDLATTEATTVNSSTIESSKS